MTLKEWNRLQCNLFKECNIDVSNIIEVYRVCSMISPLREVESYEKALVMALDLLEKSTYEEIEKSSLDYDNFEQSQVKLAES